MPLKFWWELHFICRSPGVLWICYQYYVFPTCEHGVVILSALISLLMFYIFQCTRLSPPWLCLSLSSLLFLLFNVTNKTDSNVQRFPMSLGLHTFIAYFIVTISHQSYIFITISKPTLMFHYHAKSIVLCIFIVFFIRHNFCKYFSNP